MTALPKKLSRDCILEAFVEVRFNTEEPSELVIGRLIDAPQWRDYKRNRTPISDLPVQLRLSDPSLRYQPSFDLRSPDNKFAVKIGSHVISTHSTNRAYVGWNDFRPRIAGMVDLLFKKLPDVNVRRLSLHYINATTKADHGIKSIADLNIDVKLGSLDAKDNLNVNFALRVSDNTSAMIKVASPNIVTGPMPPDATSFIEIDVYTDEKWNSVSRDEIIGWIKAAHEAGKKQFFSILPRNVVETLRED